jgi:hypothetical protein
MQEALIICSEELVNLQLRKLETRIKFNKPFWVLYHEGVNQPDLASLPNI